MRKLNGTSRKDQGIVQIYVITMMSLFAVAGLSLLQMEQSAMSDSTNIAQSNQALALAESALQEGKYLLEKINNGYTGTSGEQSVGTGTYKYTLTNTGNKYTLTGVGYVPNSTARNAIVRTLTSTFTFNLPITPGIVLLASSGAGALTIKDTAQVQIQGGKILVDSSSLTAAQFSGSASVQFPQMSLVGNYSNSGAQLQGSIVTGATAVADPFANLHVPDPVNDNLATQSLSQKVISGSQTVTLQPGVYNGGISISGQAQVTLAPGVYYINGGGFNVSQQSQVTGNGVTIYNVASAPGDAVNIGGSNQLTINAPTSGPYANVVLFQNRSSTVPITLSTSSQAELGGSIYAASAAMTATGNTQLEGNGNTIAVAQLTVSGAAQIQINNNH